MRVKVKICGITRAEDALLAAHAGADAIGFVFAESPRRVSASEARRIVDVLPPFVCAVGVFVDASREEVLSTAREARLHAVQLHGSEGPEFAGSLEGVSVIKGIRVSSRADVEEAERFSGGILLDSRSAAGMGGTGETFEWEYARELSSRRPIILAGGLTVENVEEAILAVRPWGVDVSSGVESSKGKKDAAKVKAFIERVRRSENA